MEKYQQVMPIYKKRYGSRSVNMAAVLNNMAVSLERQGEYEGAIEKYNLPLEYEGTIEKYNLPLVINVKVLGTNPSCRNNQNTQ